MKKFLLIIIIALLIRLWYRYMTSTSTTTNEATISENYTVKHIARKDAPGEDIFVYDKAKKEVLSLVNEDPQYVYKLVGDNLILDLWTSASSRILAIYDIPSKTKIFESNYYPSGKKSLAVKNNVVQFYTEVRNEFDGLENIPADAPNCSTTYNGYVETKTFDLTTKKVTATWIFTCAYFE